MKRLALSIVFGCLLAGASFGQTLDSLWSRTFGGGGNDVCNSVQQTSDSGYILAGTTASFGAGSDDFWLVKTNANGNSLWSRRFGGIGDERCYGVLAIPDGGYILAGQTSSFGMGGNDFWLVKTNANGDSLWSRTFGGFSDDRCFCVQQTMDGGYVLAGATYSYGAGQSDFWLVKMDANGNSIWSQTYGGGADECCYSVRELWEGGFVLVGETNSFGAGGYDFWLVRTDEDGDSLWSRTFGGSLDDECTSVQETWDGFVLEGSTSSFGAGNSDYWLVKTDFDGNAQWNRTFGGGNNEYCFSAQQTVDGGYALAGSTSSFGAGGEDFYLVKTDMDGNLAYSRTFGGGGADRCQSVGQTFDTGYMLAGSTTSFGAGAIDFWLVKTGLPRVYHLTVSYNPTNTNAVLRWITPDAGCCTVYGTTLMGEIGPPPAPGWVTYAFFCVAGGATEWADTAGVVPYKRYNVLMSHPEENTVRR